MSNYKSAESVSPKHPDKLCDQVSDAILDAYLGQDPKSRVAVETMGGHGKVWIVGEVTSKSKMDVAPIVKRICGDVELEVRLVHQSPEISQGVDAGGAGDQGIMVGYACDQTPQMLPLETVLSRLLNQTLYKLFPFDGKTQVTLKDGVIQSVVASFQNAPTPELKTAVKAWLKSEKLAKSVENVRLHINPAGEWQQGGFDADTGLTGRKLVVDNYGPSIPIGGGCFSGKDPSKVDRSAAYMARRIAVDYLRKYLDERATGIALEPVSVRPGSTEQVVQKYDDASTGLVKPEMAKKSAESLATPKSRLAGARPVEVFCYLAYAIGYAEPLEATVIIDGVPEVIEGYDLTPNGIIKFLDLRKPQYEETARYGHFGHERAWDN